VHFLIDADLPRSTKDLLQRYGHEATDVRDIGLGSARDPQIAAHTQRQRTCLSTGDFGFADIRNYPPAAYGGIVVLELPRNATASFILRLIEAFLQQPDVLAKLEGRLAIVEPGRVRLRPP
jgi:predicted nuclease of predicted toxin-antitoxin system